MLVHVQRLYFRKYLVTSFATVGISDVSFSHCLQRKMIILHRVFRFIEYFEGVLQTMEVYLRMSTMLAVYRCSLLWPANKNDFTVPIVDCCRSIQMFTFMSCEKNDFRVAVVDCCRRVLQYPLLIVAGGFYSSHCCLLQEGFTVAIVDCCRRVLWRRTWSRCWGAGQSPHSLCWYVQHLVWLTLKHVLILYI